MDRGTPAYSGRRTTGNRSHTIDNDNIVADYDIIKPRYINMIQTHYDYQFLHTFHKRNEYFMNIYYNNTITEDIALLSIILQTLETDVDLLDDMDTLNAIAISTQAIAISTQAIPKKSKKPNIAEKAIGIFKPVKTSKRLKLRQKPKLRKLRALTGGLFDLNPTGDTYIRDFMRHFYIFDNKHETFKDNKDLKTSGYLYNSSDIVNNTAIQSLASKDEREIFSELVASNQDICDNILYFSIYGLINYTQDMDIIGTSLIKTDSDIQRIKDNFEDFINDVLKSKDDNFLLDVKLNMGSNKFLHKFAERLQGFNPAINKDKLLDDLKSQFKNFKTIKHSLNDFMTTNRIYTLEEAFDSAPIAIEDVRTYLNTKIGQNISLFGFISYLIFNDSDLPFSNPLLNTTENKDIFKAFNKDMRALFEVAYYRKTHNGEISGVLLFKDKALITKAINILAAKNVSVNQYLIMVQQPTTEQFIYEKTSNDAPTVSYGIDIFDIRFMNSINTIEQIITMIIMKYNNINDIISNYARLTKYLKSTRLLYASCITLLYIIIKDMNLLSTSNSTILTITINNQHKKTISRLLFDFKKAGDMSKLLFVFYFTYIKQFPHVLTQQVMSKYDAITSTAIKSGLIFTSNDKLPALNSILRTENNVVFADATNYSFCVYNSNKTDTIFTFKTLLSLINIYFIGKFVDTKFNIFNEIRNETTIVDMNIKHLNTLISYMLKNDLIDKIDLKNLSTDISPIIQDLYNIVLQNFRSKFNIVRGGSRNIIRTIDLLNYINSNFTDSYKKYKKRLSTFLSKQPHDQTLEELLPLLTFNRFLNYGIALKKKKKTTGDYSVFIKYLEILYICKVVLIGFVPVPEPHDKNVKYEADAIDAMIIGGDSDSQIQTIPDTAPTPFSNILMHHASSLDDCLNKYIAYIILTYLYNIKLTIIRNLNNQDTIDFYTREILFKSINLNNPNVYKLFSLITRKMLNVVKTHIFKMFIYIEETIVLNISKLSTVANIKQIFTEINGFLKIIDLFLYFNKSSVATTVGRSDVTIHSCIMNLREFAYICFTYKYMTLTGRDKYYLSLSSLLTVPQMTGQLELIGTQYKPKNIEKMGGANEILSRIFNKTYEYINFVVIFNKYYKIFHKLSKLYILDTEIDMTDFITAVKKIYFFSYYQIHPTSIQTDLTALIEEVKTTIRNKIDNLISLPQSFMDPEKIAYLQQLQISLESKLDNTKANIYDMEQNIKRDFTLPTEGITFVLPDQAGNYAVNKYVDLYALFTGLNDSHMNALYEQYETLDTIIMIDSSADIFARIYNNIYNFF